MKREQERFLENLLNTPSPCGYEKKIQELCADFAKKYSSKIYKDTHGNQYAVLNPESEFRVMLAAHIDEVGLLVKDIDENGFLSFYAVGAVDPVVLSGQRVSIHNARGSVSGIVGNVAVHVQNADEQGKPKKIDEMWIDIGAKNNKEALKHVSIGDYVTVDSNISRLPNDLISARGLDNKIGVFVIYQALRLLNSRKLDCALYFVTTVQEELGARGAVTSSYECNPHLGLVVDTDHAGDFPGANPKRQNNCKLNQGPVIARGPGINSFVSDGLIKKAEKMKIPHQVAAIPHATHTDANPIQLSRGGVPTGLVSIATRYMHTPVETVSMKDANDAVKLLVEWITGLSPKTAGLI